SYHSALAVTALIFVSAWVSAWVSGCAGSKPSTIQTAYRDRSADIRFKKVCAIAINPDENLRHNIVDAMVKNIADSVPSYTFVAQEPLRGRDKVKQLVPASDCDGAVVVSIVSASTNQNAPSAAGEQQDMWGNYGNMMYMMNGPNYLKDAKDVVVQTNI